MIALSATCDVVGCEAHVRFAAMLPDPGYGDASVTADPLPDGRWHLCAEWIWTALPDGWTFTRSTVAPFPDTKVEIRCPAHAET